ncbi:MAG: DUF1343 domain-containing protein [Chloroflexia bacterium]|nr:DUF1343 domain-containing protein [Chloroflexia bacterium]
MPSRVLTGLDAFCADVPADLRGARVGLLTCPTAIDHNFRHAVELIGSLDSLSLVALFGPEHGIRGEAQAGDHVASANDTRKGLPVHSLYGASRIPSAEMLAGLDAMIVDMKDIAVRYATYASTTFHVIDAAEEHGIEVVILDRPNPLNGVAVQGNLLDPAFRSFVGGHSIPIRHGLTLGELATLYAREQGQRAPRVVAMKGWRRSMWQDETGLPWVLPSPNLPTLDAVTLYPATCLLEGTNLSEGRGTTKPFEFVGAPWIDPDTLAATLNGLDIAGVGFRPIFFVPTFSKHTSERCGGVQIHITDRKALNGPALGVQLLATLRTHAPDRFSWIAPNDDARPYFIDLLAGSGRLRQAIDAEERPASLVAAWQAEAMSFSERHQSVALYRD